MINVQNVEKRVRWIRYFSRPTLKRSKEWRLKLQDFQSRHFFLLAQDCRIGIAPTIAHFPAKIKVIPSSHSLVSFWMVCPVLVISQGKVLIHTSDSNLFYKIGITVTTGNEEKQINANVFSKPEKVSLLLTIPISFSNRFIARLGFGEFGCVLVCGLQWQTSKFGETNFIR